MIYQFHVDYQIAEDTDKMTAQELHDFVEAMLVCIDEYFFHGGLTQGPKRLVRLSTPDYSRHVLKGCFQFPWRYDAGRVVVYLRSHLTGGRRSKNAILGTLAHELAHAYCDLFFNHCPIDEDFQSVFIDNGHGRVWTETFDTITSHMRWWDPSLAGLGQPEDEMESFFAEVYFWLAARIRALSRAWDATTTADLKADDGSGMDIVVPARGWKWRPGRRAELRSAMLRMVHLDREHLVATKIPYPSAVYVYIYPVMLVVLAWLGFRCLDVLWYLGRCLWEWQFVLSSLVRLCLDLSSYLVDWFRVAYMPDREMRGVLLMLLLQLLFTS